MSRTLFWYVFKDLLRVFILASAALAGIMSFGGLLRPLTEHGLDVSQVTRILGYFMPAMQTYSLPVAALFATTMVYGRLSADNELTACRAAGIGYWPMWMPALVLGLLVATLSLVFLCYVVPVFTLKVEKVIYSNLAQLVANEIEHDHHIQMMGGDDSQTIFAQKAFVLPAPRERPKDQVVQLVGPLFVRYEKQTQKGNAVDRRPPRPEDFYTATRATVFITQDEATGEVRMQAKLAEGSKFPRSFGVNENGKKPMQLSMEKSSFISDPFPSPVRENVKFMPIGAINHLLEHPDESRRIKTLLAGFVREEQQRAFLTGIADALNSRAGEAELDAGGGETYILTRGASPVEIHGDKLYVGPPAHPNDPQPRLRQMRSGQSGVSAVGLDATAQQIRIRSWPDADNQSLSVEADLTDAVTRIGDEDALHSNFARDFVLPMPSEVRHIATHTAHFYARDPSADPEQKSQLNRELIKLYNAAVSEKHARVSFAMSCLILVMVGCALGMMFKSGNFLSAFALSVVPALMCIVLVVTGQHICQNVPYPIPKNFTDPLVIGLSLIWSGNAAVFVMGVMLLWRLSKQ